MKYGLSGKKLHERLTVDELVDVGEGKFKILTSSPESLSEKKYGLSYYYYAQKLCVAIDKAHCVLQWLVQLLIVFYTLNLCRKVPFLF